MIRITMYPAGNGDSFLIQHKGTSRTAVLIDGGYASTFDNHLKPALTSLAATGYELDLMVATHVDSDHISGLVKLLTTHQRATPDERIPIHRVWHNSLRSLSTDRAAVAALTDGDRELLTEIHTRGFAPPTATIESDISAQQGSSLASLLRSGSFDWNDGDGSSPIAFPLVWQLGTEVRITVLGPSEERLTGLRDWWLTEIRRLGVAATIKNSDLMEDVCEFLSSYEANSGLNSSHEISATTSGDRDLADVYSPDVSVTNSSSIALIFETAKRRLLFLGDSWAEDIEKALQSTQKGPSPWTFDAIKISHHGSLRNTSPTILTLIDSPRYFISTNGERHDHPDVEVLKAIVDRPSPFARDLYFNCSTPASNQLKMHASRSGSAFRVHEDPLTVVAIPDE